jgi:hypothetical protein
VLRALSHVLIPWSWAVRAEPRAWRRTPPIATRLPARQPSKPSKCQPGRISHIPLLWLGYTLFRVMAIPWSVPTKVRADPTPSSPLPGRVSGRVPLHGQRVPLGGRRRGHLALQRHAGAAPAGGEWISLSFISCAGSFGLCILVGGAPACYVALCGPSPDGGLCGGPTKGEGADRAFRVRS